MRKLMAVAAVTAIVLSACTPGPSKSSASQQGQQITESYQKKLTAAVPYPLAEMSDSVERRNLRERLLRFNKPDKIGYVYLLAQTGQVIAFYTIKGKVSSANSQMTNGDISECHGERCNGAVVRQSPTDDGSYGPNEDGIFFFTTENVMVQWSGQYLYADAPLKVTSAPVLVYDAGSTPTNTSGK